MATSTPITFVNHKKIYICFAKLSERGSFGIFRNFLLNVMVNASCFFTTSSTEKEDQDVKQNITKILQKY